MVWIEDIYQKRITELLEHQGPLGLNRGPSVINNFKKFGAVNYYILQYY